MEADGKLSSPEPAPLPILMSGWGPTDPQVLVCSKSGRPRGPTHWLGFGGRNKALLDGSCRGSETTGAGAWTPTEMPQGPQRQVAESSLLLSKAQFSSFQVQDTTYKTDLGVSGEGAPPPRNTPSYYALTVHVIPSPPQPL